MNAWDCICCLLSNVMLWAKGQIVGRSDELKLPARVACLCVYGRSQRASPEQGQASALFIDRFSQLRSRYSDNSISSHWRTVMLTAASDALNGGEAAEGYPTDDHCCTLRKIFLLVIVTLRWRYRLEWGFMAKEEEAWLTISPLIQQQQNHQRTATTRKGRKAMPTETVSSVSCSSVSMEVYQGVFRRQHTNPQITSAVVALDDAKHTAQMGRGMLPTTATGFRYMEV